MKKKKRSKLEKQILLVTVYTTICFLGYIIFDIIIDFNILFGVIAKSICGIGMIIIPFVLTIKGIMAYKENTIKDILLFVFLIIIFALSIFKNCIDIVNSIKDCFATPKQLIIENYNVSKRRGGNLSSTYYVLKGYDKNGKKYKFKTKEYISDYYDDKKIKITYYKNLKMVKSFKYIDNNY